MTLGWLLAVVCFVIGFLVAASVIKLWMDPLSWLVASIAAEMIFDRVGPVIIGRKREA